MSFNRDAPSTLSNLRRLQGLASLGTRKRVMPAYNRMDIDAPELDVESAEDVNIPEPTPDGGFTTQSYDVRANEVIEPEQPQNPYFALGKNLGSYLSAQSAGNTRVMENQPQAPMQPPPEEEVSVTETMESPQGQFPLTPPETLVGEEPRKYSTRELQRAVQERTTRGSPMYGKGVDEILAASQEAQADSADVRQGALEESVRIAQEQPWQSIAYGATDVFANTPELKRQFSEYTGVDVTPEIEERIRETERVMADLDKPLAQLQEQYTQDEAALRSRIENQEATESDKFMMGLALLMPILVGGFFGAEAGLGALAGAAGGVTKQLETRAKRLEGDRESLRNIQKDKANLALKRGELNLEKTKIPKTVRAAFPKDQTEHLKGRFESWVDPQTGEVEGGKEILPDFVVPVTQLQDKDAVKDYTKQARTLAEGKKRVEKTNRLTKDLIDAATQIEDKNLVIRAMNAFLLDEDPKNNTYLKKLAKLAAADRAPKIKYEGREVNAYRHMKSLVEALVDAYRQNNQMRALTNTVAQHFEAIAKEPISGGSKMDDFVDQMLKLRDASQNYFVDDVQAQGFFAEPMIDTFGKQNRELYKGLNLKKDVKERNEIADELSTQEFNG